MEHNLELFWVARVSAVSFDSGYKPLQAGGHIQRWHSLRYFPGAPYRIKIADDRFDLPAGSYFCIPPDVPIHLTPLSNTSRQYLDIKFRPLSPFLTEHLQSVHPPQSADPSSRAMLDYIVENWHLQDPGVQETCRSFLSSLLLLLFAAQTPPDALGSQFIRSDHYNKAALMTLRYIEAHYLNHFSLEDLGKATGYNKSYLCTNFARSTGVTIVDYTNFLRIRKAVGALLHFPTRISTVCESLGFHNLNYFSRTFKSFVGIPPRDFQSVALRITAEERARLCESEPLLNYQLCPIEEALDSMRHIGAHFSALLTAPGDEAAR